LSLFESCSKAFLRSFRAKSFLLFDGFFKKGFSARNRFVFIAACVAVKAARRFKNPAPEPGFLFLFSSPAIEQGFFVFGPTPVSLPKADASDLEADLFEDSR